jgi:hypothetical protein
MEPGVLALIGIFALAAVFAWWNHRRSRAIESRLLALGFERCEGESQRLLRAWCDLALVPPDEDDEIAVGRCLRRPAGFGMLYRFQVSAGRRDSGRDEPSVPATFPAYLLDLRDPEKQVHRPTILFVLPPGPSVLQALLRRTLEISPPGRRLEMGPHPFLRSVLTAYGASEGKLDDHLPLGTQEKVARAAEHGFFEIRLGRGRAAFSVLPNHVDVDAELRHLAEWA